VVGGDRLDRPVLERLQKRLSILLGAKRRVHLHVRVERAHRLVREAEVVRRHLATRLHARRAGAPQLVHGLPRREVQQMDRLALVGGEHEVAPHHDALGDRRIPAEAELRRDEAFVHLSPAGKRRLLAVDGDPPPCDRVVLERAAQEPGRGNGPPVIAESRRAALGELDHLGELGPVLALADRCEESHRDLGVALCTLDERPEHRSRVDCRLRVRHGEDRAVAARGGGLRSRCDVLLVFATRGP
jgi:hypothetical protein